MSFPGLPAEPISRTAPPLRGEVVASQRWSRLAFIHWRVDAAAVAPLLPSGTRPDVFDGSSWVGLIGFHLGSARLFGSPPIPLLGSFAEINVRLYAVDAVGRRGVVFASLEASSLAAVVAARAAFSIPYFWSRTSIESRAESIHYSAARHVGGGATSFVVRPTPEILAPDALADFLTARWGLFTTRFGRTIFLPNEHEEWVLHPADLLDLDDDLVGLAGLPGIASRRPDSVLWADPVTARFGSLRSTR